MSPAHPRLMVVAAVATAVLLVLPSPASAATRAVARPRAGTACARRAVGTVTTARSGVTVRCTRLARPTRYRWVTVTTTAPVAPPAPVAPTTSYTATGWRADMLARVNAERAKVGAGPLSACPRLDAAGQMIVSDNAARGTLDHVSADGATVSVRDTRSGYLVGANGWKVGENIALGFTDVASVMTGWMNSPGHRANLLDPAYTHLGMAELNAASGHYWSQEFGVGGTC